MDKNEIWLNFIEELKTRNDIVDVVASYTNLNRKGNRHWACCPFHHEKTPSFSISPEMQMYKCFGCGDSGDVITFVQKIESTDFMGAVEILANRAGLQIPQTTVDKGVQDKKKRKQAMAQICLESARFYNAHLFSPQGQFAIDYLKKRGLSVSTIKRFGLGLSPDWDGLKRHLYSKKLSLELAYECGVLGKKGDRYYDSLGERLIVPIINSLGEVIAFGGRSMKKDVDFAKYKNTQQTDLFDKSKNLFGINLVSKKKKQGTLDYIIVVEGYMDAIALHQAGFDSAVASMGTSLTKEQAKLMKRYVERVYICYDGDGAGTKGTLRGLEILKAEGLDVRVMSMPDGVDPDELILQYGAGAFQQAMDDALPLTDYKLKIEKTHFNFNSKNEADRQDAKRKYTIKALEIIAQLGHPVEMESYLIKLSKETGFSLDWLKRSLAGEKQAAKQQPAKQNGNQKFVLDQHKKALYYILKCMLAGEDYATLNFELDLDDDEFLTKSFAYVNKCKSEDKKPVPSMLVDIFEGKYKENIDYLQETVFTTTIENKQFFADCAKLVQKNQVQNQIEKLTKQSQDEPEQEKRKQLWSQIATLNKQLIEINKR
ncbi:MAG: DNA primase [Clostridia bacterium]|nr:DNA primase [Clostridia bacterium]